MQSPLTLIASYLEVFVVLYAFLLSLILVHELGHLTAGLLCGFRLVRIRVGPCIFEPASKLNDQRLTLWKWHWAMRDLCSGSVLMRATKRAMSRTSRRYFMYLLAGPLANLGVALVAFRIAGQETTIGGIAKYFVIGSVLLGVGNLLPFKRKNLESDGRKLIALLFSKEKRQALLFELTLLERIQEVRTLYQEGQIRLSCDKAEEIAIQSERVPELMASSDYRQALKDFRSLFQRLAPRRTENQREAT